MVRRTLTFDKGFRLFMRALSANGTRIGVTCAEYDVSAGCQSPRTVEYVGRRERFMVKHHLVQPNALDPLTWESVSVIVHCKCRACPACLKKRRIHWYFRAKFETSVAPRTWFGTLTYAPDQILVREIRARRKCLKAGLDWDAMLEDVRFKHLLSECGRDVGLYFKRLRKSNAPLRYLLVSERHKSGLPHWHVLVHETGRGQIPHRELKRCWDAGFCHFKLADSKAPGYVAKYISKDVGARVRASVNYGDTSAFSVSLPLPQRAVASEGDAREA